MLKFIGDAVLATFSFEEADRAETCRRALDAAIEAMQNLDTLNALRLAAGEPVASVDLALHIGEVLYGNVGATDRLDFTVIGPAVNEATRIEALCEPLGRSILVSPEFAAAAMAGDSRLQSLGRHALRGVREPKEIFALDLGGAAIRTPSSVINISSAAGRRSAMSGSYFGDRCWACSASISGISIATTRAILGQTPGSACGSLRAS